MDLLLHQVFISSLALPQNTTPVSRRSLSEQVGNPCTGSPLWHKHQALYFFKLHIFVKLLSFFSIVTLKRKKKKQLPNHQSPPKKANKTQLAHLCSFYTHRWPLEVPSNSTIVWFYNSLLKTLFFMFLCYLIAHISLLFVPVVSFWSLFSKPEIACEEAEPCNQ